MGSRGRDGRRWRRWVVEEEIGGGRGEKIGGGDGRRRWEEEVRR